ncbi:MAG TPA: DUF3372 domain-containing protein [Pseudomonadota bacterium]|nr:DUF3372 domain-containing protein [Pseudomonadota bacterium]
MKELAFAAGRTLVPWLVTLLAPALAQAQVLPAPRVGCDVESTQAVLHAAPAGPALPARAVWLTRQLARWPGVPADGRFRLYHSAQGGIVAATGATVAGADGALELAVHAAALAPDVAARFAWVGEGIVLAVRDADLARLPELHRQQLVLAREDAGGRLQAATTLQVAAALDDLYADAAGLDDLGVRVGQGRSAFRLWAPTARKATLCLHERGTGAAFLMLPMQRDEATGSWRAKHAADLSGNYYTYLVEVHVPGVGVVRNRVTDPYATSLTTQSRRAWIGELGAASLAPPGWADTPPPARVAAATDMAIYELHVRDFSIGDASVSAANRGKYLAFTETGSAGMRHLRALSASGITDVHLLPAFDFATVPETGCTTPAPSGPPDGEAQQALVTATQAGDCYNWGYDPLHYTAPEGSYASDPADGAVRILEFRRMVQALHRAGLRVGMDVVYNHTSAAGQAPNSVLDGIVPGYYHRLDASGAVATSTCCANTATENLMMGKLMIDSVVVWARDHHIDSFRFDLMGHQPRAVMEALKARVDAAAGREVQLLGEGWNFGEVANGARFVQASQLSLNGSGIATFSDRARDAVRGGSAGDSDARQVSAQGWINGLVYDRNALAPADLGQAELMRMADLVRVGLAGSLRSYPLQTYRGETVPMERIDYNGQPAGYVSQPGEVVNYVENHDNQTLYDLNAFKLPTATRADDRARVQVLGLATTAFSQGIAYFHAGSELLRSKSMDRNSYDSGDWFNRLDWSGQDNFFGTGLPPRRDNGASWDLMRPRLADAALRPAPEQIAYTRDAFRDLLRIRASSTLFRLRSAAEVEARLRLLNTGPAQAPTVLVGHLDGEGYAGAGFRELLYFINVDPHAREIVLPGEGGKDWRLHPVHQDPAAADPRPAASARYDATNGRFTIPARTAMVWVVD